MIDGGKKSFPRGYRCPIAAKKVFHGAIDARWRQKKFSTGLSMPDGAIKRIPLRYRTPTDLLTMQKRQGVSVVRTGTPSVYEKFCFFSIAVRETLCETIKKIKKELRT